MSDAPPSPILSELDVLVTDGRLMDAVDAWLGKRSLPNGYRAAPVAGYEALWADDPLLLRSDDESLYVAEDVSESLRSTLRQRRFRPTGTTLALRLPAPSAGSSEATGASAVGVFRLWATPKYLAVLNANAGDTVWK